MGWVEGYKGGGGEGVGGVGVGGGWGVEGHEGPFWPTD